MYCVIEQLDVENGLCKPKDLIDILKKPEKHWIGFIY